MAGLDLRFNIPSNMLIVGPTSSGKTTWLKYLIQNRHEYFSEPPGALLLFHKESQKAYDIMETEMNQNTNSNNKFLTFKKYKKTPKSIEEMKEILDLYPRKLPKIVVFDDYLDEVGHVLKHMFTVLTHHYNCFTVSLYLKNLCFK